MILSREKLQRLRASKNWTQKQLASKVGYSDRTIQNAESGIEHVSKEVAEDLAELFGVHLTDLLPEGGNQKLGWPIPGLPPWHLERREHVERVLEFLLRSDENQNYSHIVGIYGMAGLGKSVLAADVARAPKTISWFRDGIFWFNIGIRPSSWLQMFQQLSYALGSDEKLHDDVHAKQHLRTVLAEKRCLLILDDVWTSESLKAFDMFPKSTRILTTTREKLLLTGLGANEYPLELLSQVDSLELLSRWSKERVDSLPEDAMQVAEECGRLPLAIAISGAMVRDGVPWNVVNMQLKQANLKFIEHAGFDTNHNSVYRALKISVDYLYSENAVAVQRYLELSNFPPDKPIQEQEVIEWWEHLGTPSHEGHKMLGILAGKSLLTIEQSRGTRSVLLHDLQHDFIRAKYEFRTL